MLNGVRLAVGNFSVGTILSEVRVTWKRLDIRAESIVDLAE
jgi:hypothetical protein